MSDDGPPVLHRGVGAPSACRSCKAPIVWAISMITGKPIPFQVDPVGVWTIENGAAKYTGRPAGQLELGAKAPERYTSHFATCPDAPKWRRRK